MNPVTIRYAFRPVRRSLATGQAADQFGLAGGETEHIVAEGLDLDIDRAISSFSPGRPGVGSHRYCGRPVSSSVRSMQ